MTSIPSFKNLFVLASILLALPSPSFGATLSPRDGEPSAAARNAPSVAYLPQYLMEDQDDKALYLLLQFESILQNRKKGTDLAEALLFVKALIHGNAGRISRTIELFRKGSAIKGDMAPYADYHEGELAYEMGDFSRAASFYEKAKKRRDRRLSKLASFKSALALQKAEEIDKAILGYNSFISINKKDALADAAVFSLAEAYRDKGMLFKSAMLYRSLWLDRPQSRYYERARSRYEGLAREDKFSPPKTSCNKMERHAAKLFKLRRYEKAKLAFDDFSSICQKSGAARDWQIYYAVSLYFSRNNDKGVALLDSVIRGTPKGRGSEESLYWLARFFYRLKSMPGIMRAGDLLSSNFPRSGYADNIAYLKGSFYGENGYPDRAIHQFKKMILDHRGSTFIERAWWHIGWIHYTSGDYINASAAFNEVPARSRTSHLAPDALYWMGRSQENLGLKSEAARTYENISSEDPLSYYGLRATERLRYLKLDKRPGSEDRAGQGGALTHQPDAQIGSQRRQEESEIEEGFDNPAPGKASLIKAVKNLFDDSLYDETEESIQKALVDSPEVNLAESSRGSSLCLRPDTNSNVRTIIRRLIKEEAEGSGKAPSHRHPDEAFPRCQRKAIEHYAEVNRLNPNLLYSVVMAESNFNKDALSHVGAIGLMQLMPGLARRMSSRMNLPAPFEDELYGAELNLKYGSAYLAELLEIFGGELAPAVASYNAPLQEVMVWRAKHRTGNSEEFVAGIPFYETRKYTQKVLALHEIYNGLYPGVGPWQKKP